MTITRGCHALLGASLMLGGCVSIPPGPSVMVLPGSRTSFEQFQIDDYACRGFAGQQSGATAQQAAAESGVAAAAIGTAAGAAIGAAAGDAAAGAAIGAGSGLLLGAASGASNAGLSAAAVQQRYDHAYMQCMYAKGNQIPVARSALQRPAQAPRSVAPPPPRSAPRDLAPAPPAGPPPPPPPDAG